MTFTLLNESWNTASSSCNYRFHVLSYEIKKEITLTIKVEDLSTKGRKRVWRMVSKLTLGYPRWGTDTTLKLLEKGLNRSFGDDTVSLMDHETGLSKLINGYCEHIRLPEVKDWMIRTKQLKPGDPFYD